MLVLTAVAAFAFFLIMALAIDFGNLSVHNRQLQNRVDAAALAAGLEYGTRFKDCATSAAPDANFEIKDVAKKYSGTVTGIAYNAEVTDPVVTVSEPCTPDNGYPGYSTQVAASEANFASFFPRLGMSIIDPPKASARVAIAQVATATGVFPLAASDPAATGCAWATVGTNTPLQLTFASGVWSGTTDSAWPPMPAASTPVGVTVGDCSDPDDRASYPKVGYISSLPASGAPLLTDIQLVPTGCGNAYFIPYDAPGPDCQIGVTASVTFGSANAPTATAVIGGASFPLVLQVPDADGDPNTVTFELPPTVAVPAQSGAVVDGTIPVTILVGNNGAPETPIAGGSQSIMAGDEGDEGPLLDVTLSRHAVVEGEPIGTTIDVRLRGLSTQSTGVDVLVPVNCGAVSATTGGCTAAYEPKPPAITCVASSGAPDCVQGVNRNAPASLAALRTAYDTAWGGMPCTPNNLSAGVSNLLPSDPRLITVFVTSSRSPSNPGKTYPVTGFAGFYVTGWDGGGSCAQNTRAPRRGSAGNGIVWGHFVERVLPTSAGTPTASRCLPSLTDVSACIAELVE